MGAVHVPVNFALKGEELRHILRDADVALIAADPALLGLAEEAAADLTRERGAEALAVWPLLPADEQREASVLETASEASLGEEAPSVEIAPQDLAQVLYTSGTTSAPKGAMMTQRALVAEYLSAIIALDLCAEDRPLVAMPPDERWGEAITAVIVVHPDQQLTAETVRRHARERLADHKVPKRVEFVAELPRNQSGKLLKRQLRAERSQDGTGTASTEDRA